MSLQDIEKRVRTAEMSAGREIGAVSLIAVSKVQPPERVKRVLENGHRTFGENRVQEAMGKWPDWKEAYPDTSLHLLGPLQTNKARAALSFFDVIHTLDRLKLARALARLAQEEGKCPELFVQVNTGEEQQKAGIAPDELDAFIVECRDLDLPVKGLMCIPPIEEEPTLHFALLGKLANRNGLERLSMGMSADFETAIKLGSTHVRVGSAIFGERVPAVARAPEG